MDINGVELRSIKYYPNHEDQLVPYAKIYQNGKAIGEYTEDNWGGGPRFHFINQAEAEKCISALNEGFIKLGFRPGINGIKSLYNSVIEEFAFLFFYIADLEKSLQQREKSCKKKAAAVLSFRYIEDVLYDGKYYHYEPNENYVAVDEDSHEGVLSGLDELKKSTQGDVFLILSGKGLRRADVDAVFARIN